MSSLSKKSVILGSMLSTLCFVALVIHLNNFYEIKFDTPALFLLFLALMPWLSLFIENATLPGGWRLEFRELKEEIKDGQERLHSIEQGQQKLINDFVIYSLGAVPYTCLWDIGKKAHLIYHNKDDFRRWMNLLLDMGYIESKRSGEWIDFNDSKFHEKNLAEEIKPTPAGWYLLELRGDPHSTPV